MEIPKLSPGVALLQLISAPDDPPLPSTEYQRDLGAVLHSLRSNGISTSGLYCGVDTAGGNTTLSGTFVVSIATLSPVLGSALKGWLSSRYGRRAQLRVADHQVEAGSEDEVAGLLRLAKRAQHGKS